MKFTVKASDLATAAARVAKIGPARTSIPILQHMLVKIDDNGLTLTGHDLDRSLVLNVDGDISEPGAATVDAARFAKLLKAFDGGTPVKITADEKSVSLQAGRSRYRFDSLAPGDFPEPLTFRSDVEHTEDTEDASQEGQPPTPPREMVLDDAARHRLFELPQFAISTEETRRYLNGVFLTAKDGQATAVATDGHRLLRAFAAVTAAGEWPDIIVPTPAVASIIALGADRLITDGKILQATAKDAVFASKLIDGSYPAWQRVVPSPSGNSIEFGVDEMLDALARLRAIANKEDAQKRSGVCGLEWSSGGDSLTLCLPRTDTAQDIIAGTASDDDRGGRFACCINYLFEALENLDAERVILDSADPGSPVRIAAPGSDEVLSVLMPMRW